MTLGEFHTSQCEVSGIKYINTSRKDTRRADGEVRIPALPTDLRWDTDTYFDGDSPEGQVRAHRALAPLLAYVALSVSACARAEGRAAVHVRDQERQGAPLQGHGLHDHRLSAVGQASAAAARDAGAYRQAL